MATNTRSSLRRTLSNGRSFPICRRSGRRNVPTFLSWPLDAEQRPSATGEGVRAAASKWVLWGANGNYLLGGFDGTKFTRESGPHRFEFGGNFYAAQSYSDIPAADGRRIQIAWMNGGRYPKMPFNQQMSIPAELTLRPDARWAANRPLADPRT